MTDLRDHEVRLVGHDDQEAYATLVLAASALCAANQLMVMADGPPPSSEYLEAGMQMLTKAVMHWLDAQPDYDGAYAAMVEVGHDLFTGNEKHWPGGTS